MIRAGLAVYACEPDEAELFGVLSPRFGVVPTITGDPLSVANAAWATGRRSVSVGHKAEVGEHELRALREAGVEHVSTRSVGVDHVDVAAAASLGIAVDAVGYDPDGVADFTLMLILMAIRSATDVIGAVARHDFRLRSRGRDLRDLTVGVVGVGRIGSAVIRRLEGFGCQVLASTRGPAAGLGVATLVTLDELLLRSDVVTLHVPLDRDTHHLVGEAEIARMKPGAVLVNTSRGALVDTDALLTALDGGRLGGAALDVVEGESGVFYRDWTDRDVERPLLRLLAMPNVIVTPHTAFHTRRALLDTVERTLTSCLNRERNRTDGETQDRDPVRRLLRGA